MTDNSQKDKKIIQDQKKKIKALEKGLNRKEKALVEMAALMTLKKKQVLSGGKKTTDSSIREKDCCNADILSSNRRSKKP